MNNTKLKSIGYPALSLIGFAFLVVAFPYIVAVFKAVVFGLGIAWKIFLLLIKFWWVIVIIDVLKRINRIGKGNRK